MMKNCWPVYRPRWLGAMRNMALGLMLIFAFIAAAYAQDMQTGQRLKIGLLLPLTGPQAALGESLQNAAMMGLFSARNPDLAIVPYDTAGRADQAVLAANRAVADGVGAILGPVFSAETKAIGAIVPASIPILSFSNDVSAAKGSVFLLGLTPQSEVIQVLQNLESRGVRILHVVASDTVYGKSVMEAAKFFTARGTMKLQTEGVYQSSNPKTLANALAKIRNALPASNDAALMAYHAILIGDTASSLPALAAELVRHDLSADKVLIAGTGVWADADFTNLPQLHGAFYPGFDPRVIQSFHSGYQSYFNAAPPSLAALAYDGMAVLAQAATQPALAGLPAFLRQNPAFSTLSGPLSFGENQLAARRFMILRANAGGPVPAM